MCHVKTEGGANSSGKKPPVPQCVVTPEHRVFGRPGSSRWLARKVLGWELGWHKKGSFEPK